MLRTTIPSGNPDSPAELHSPRAHEQLLTFRLHHIAKAAGERASRLFREGHALSRRQVRLLSLLAGGIHRSPSELAALAGADRARISRTLDPLERRGFITRRPVPGDARRQLVSLTEAGERLYSKLFKEVKALNEELLAPLEPWHREGLDRALELLERQLGTRTARAR